jgi:hypothetical protein
VLYTTPPVHQLEQRQGIKQIRREGELGACSSSSACTAAAAAGQRNGEKLGLELKPLTQWKQAERRERGSERRRHGSHGTHKPALSLPQGARQDTVGWLGG